MVKKILIVLLLAVAVAGMKSPCGCIPNTALKKMLSTPGSVKFGIVK